MIDAELLLRRACAAEEAGDYLTARDLYEEAAALGEEIGLCGLAYMFDVGLGMPADKVEAMRLYRLAWRQRSAVAANNIAILYRERGDRRAMFRWFRRCVEAGGDDAHLQLAKCFAEGAGVRRSLELAVRSLAIVLKSQWVSEEDREEAEAMMANLRPRLVTA